MRSRYILGVAVAALAVLPIGVGAHTIHVPLDQPTIQDGLDAADTGDTVLVAADTYTGALNRNLDFAGKGITLLADSRFVAVIDCEGAGRAFHFHSGEDTTAVVHSFTIMNAAADSGAGVMCRAGASPRFLYCRFEGNAATDQGGGVCCIGGAPVFRSCEFEGNNVSGGTGEHGGGIACVGESSPTLAGCVFAGNSSASSGGAAYSHRSDPTFTNCSFLANSSVYGGGGVYGVSSGSPTVTDCVFTGNTGSQGGAIYTQSCPATVTRCTFSEHAYRAVCFLYNTSIGNVSDCTFVDNVSHFHCFDSANAAVSNCTFVGSSATGGGVTMNEASPTFENCIFALSTNGPAAHCDGGAETPSFVRCVLYSNAGGDELCGSVSDTLHRNPLFCDAAGGEFDLCEDSVCAPGNNVWTELIGAWDVGCPPCGSPVESATWGVIKGLFR
jgi:predicted outer membrane repeat protein